MEVSDEALLAGVAGGDADAMAAFVRRHQARVFGMALSVVGVPAVAEEVAQEAFVRAWRHAGNYDPRRARASTWLLTITRNVAIDVLRVRRELATEPVAMAELLMAPSNDGDRVDDADDVTAALRELPKDQAVAVVLSVHFGLTAREIGERQHVPLGTAKTRIRTGLTRLRGILEVRHD
ncbi:sigma-70 family RNA polymerase sigma factor [Glycomyces paridis]|uniref:RNA polymerase sigma factor n=1 Tax=Glycomyces paridis TaxID=2126555 RepID=A0A4S8P3G8_9ACTN|nr:sigma-70 family RNA polymerase sigma factor [Glycomyces paridis]THV24567.1 sigma-70 family RNA polymerase sigma factor [Glycomyces paridis]